MKVYVIRHGESEGNAQRRHSGWAPFELTEKGRAQAEESGKVIRDIPFDRIFVSDILRTQQTAAILFPDRIADFELRDTIREFNSGRVVGHKYDDLVAELGEMYLSCRANCDFTPLGGENPEGFVARIGEFFRELEEIARENGDEKPLNVAVVAHAGVLRGIGQLVTGAPYRQNIWSNENCSINVLEYKDGVWRILLWNYAPALFSLCPEA